MRHLSKAALIPTALAVTALPATLAQADGFLRPFSNPVGSRTLADPSAELQRIQQLHFWNGQRVKSAVLAAAGPDVTLLRDTRAYGEPSRCNFVVYRGARAMVCYSI